MYALLQRPLRPLRAGARLHGGEDRRELWDGPIAFRPMTSDNFHFVGYRTTYLSGPNQGTYEHWAMIPTAFLNQSDDPQQWVSVRPDDAILFPQGLSRSMFEARAEAWLRAHAWGNALPTPLRVETLKLEPE